MHVCDGVSAANVSQGFLQSKLAPSKIHSRRYDFNQVRWHWLIESGQRKESMWRAVDYQTTDTLQIVWLPACAKNTQTGADDEIILHRLQV